MATAPSARTEAREAVQRFLIHSVHWNIYESLLRELGDRPIRLTFDRGDLELMSLPDEQNLYTRLVDKLVKTLAEVTKTPLKCGKRLIFKRHELERGLEPDRYYYIDNDLPAREMREFNSAYDLPPDLVVEIDLLGSNLDRLGMYAAFWVPEVWRFDGRALGVYGLQGGRYDALACSPRFPFPPLTEALQFLHQCETMDESCVVPSLHAWIREQIATESPPESGLNGLA
jgi:Uma2 family endonuclease